MLVFWALIKAEWFLIVTASLSGLKMLALCWLTIGLLLRLIGSFVKLYKGSSLASGSF